MLRRIRQLLTIIFFCFLLAVLALWASDDAFIARSYHRAEARCYVAVYRGALHVDHTGLYYVLRDFTRAGEVTFAREPIDCLPSELQTAIAGDGPFTFSWQTRFVRRVPLQDLTNSVGQPIYLEQSLPMKLLTVPAWLVAVLLAIAPGRAFVQRVRGGRKDLLAPLHWLSRRGIAIWTLVSIGICIAWVTSILRPAMCYSAAPNQPSYAWCSAKSAQGEFTLFNCWQAEHDYRKKYVGTGGLEFERPEKPVWTLIAPAGQTISGGGSSSRHVPYWMLFVLTAFVPMTWMAMRIWGRRQLDGHCANCDYDLRYSTERCPECGRPVDAASPRISRRRVQAARFALAAILLLLAGTMAAAWVQGSGTENAELLISGKGSDDSTWLQVSNGKLSLQQGQRVAMIRSSVRATATQLFAVPAWMPTAALLGASATAFWLARREGRVFVAES